MVAELPAQEKQERTQLVENEIEELVVEAKKLGISLAEINDAVAARWTRLGASPEARPKREGRKGR